MNFLNASSARFELRNLRNRIERWIGQLIYCQLFSPMVGNENRIFANSLDDQCRKDTITTTRDDFHALAIQYVQLFRGCRVDFNVRFRTLLNQKTDAASLIPG